VNHKGKRCLFIGSSASPSTLRKVHDKISDPKYDGVKTTRKLLQEDSEDDTVRSEDEEEGNFSEHVYEDQSAEGGADEISSGSDVVNEGLPPTSPNTSPNKSPQDHGSRDGLTSMLQKTRDEDRKKGRAISRQIVRLTGNLRDSSVNGIRAGYMGYSFGCSNTDAEVSGGHKQVSCGKFSVRLRSFAKVLSQPSDLRDSLQSPDYTGVVLRMMEEATTLSNEIFELQEVLMPTLFNVFVFKLAAGLADIK
jgi:protein AATF/BFR2